MPYEASISAEEHRGEVEPRHLVEVVGMREAECDLHWVGLPVGEEKGENRGERPGGPFRGASSISKRRGSFQKGWRGRSQRIEGWGGLLGGCRAWEREEMVVVGSQEVMVVHFVFDTFVPVVPLVLLVMVVVEV